MVSCAQRIKVPINRMMEPEVMGGGLGVEYRDLQYSRGVLNFSDNSTSNPLTMSTVKNKEFYMGLGLGQIVDLFVRVPEESSSLIGLKIQLIGSPVKAGGVGHSLAFTLGTGSERDSFEQNFTIDLKSDVTDFSLIHGYRLSPFFLIYEGVSVSNYTFQGDITGAVGLDSDELEYEARNILGAFAGLSLGYHTFKLKMEYAVQRIKWTYTDEKVFQAFGWSLSAGW